MYIGQDQVFEAALRILCAALEGGDSGLIGRVGPDGIVKNGRIGGDTGDGIFADPTGQFTRFDELAGKVVQPDLLAEGRNSGDA